MADICPCALDVSRFHYLLSQSHGASAFDFKRFHLLPFCQGFACVQQNSYHFRQIPQSLSFLAVSTRVTMPTNGNWLDKEPVPKGSLNVG